MNINITQSQLWSLL